MRFLSTGGLLAAATLVLSGEASAFVLRTTEGGVPVHWETDTVQVIVDESVDDIDPAAQRAIERAFAHWASVSEANAPRVVFTVGETDEVGYRSGDVNHNTIRYARRGFAPAKEALAITILTFDAAGAIVDADIVISGGEDRPFAILPDPTAPASMVTSAVGLGPQNGSAFDLEDVLTHEAGHFFGLAHNNAEPSATMYFEIGRGETSKRHLTEDDQLGLSAAYPALAPSASCAVTTPSPGPRKSPFALLAALVGAAVASSRSRRRAGDRAERTRDDGDGAHGKRRVARTGR